MEGNPNFLTKKVWDHSVYSHSIILAQVYITVFTKGGLDRAKAFKYDLKHVLM